jgi:hypothetical protein
MSTRARNLPDDRPEDLRALSTRLGKVADLLTVTGAVPAEWIEQTLGSAFRALMELAEYRAGNGDPRRQRSLALGSRMERAQRAGSSVGEIADAFGCSRSTVHRRLTDVAEHRATVSVFTEQRTIQNPKQESSV